jgi:hypothetical protein
MTDLLQRLRSFPDDPWYTDAAAEIERLARERDEAEALAQSLQNKLASRPLSDPDLIAAVDSLTRERDKAWAYQLAAANDVADLTIERDRLRAALERIADSRADSFGDIHASQRWWTLKEIARAALAGEKHEGP